MGTHVVRARRVRREAVTDAQHERLTSIEVPGSPRLDLTPAGSRGVPIHAAAVELVDEVHVQLLVELDASCETRGMTLRCTSSAASPGVASVAVGPADALSGDRKSV